MQYWEKIFQLGNSSASSRLLLSPPLKDMDRNGLPCRPLLGKLHLAFCEAEPWSLFEYSSDAVDSDLVISISRWLVSIGVPVKLPSLQHVKLLYGWTMLGCNPKLDRGKELLQLGLLLWHKQSQDLYTSY